MRNGVKYNWSRRHFLKASFIFGLTATFIQSCKQKANGLFLRLTGTNHILGHRLRFPDFPKPSEEVHIPVLILGAGISGLSAGYQLKESGFSDFLILEMEEQAGGNSRSGENQYSKYPLGAHYLPIPNASNQEIYQFLKKVGIVFGWTNDGKPIFDEEQLSFAPQSRLFIKNYWQEGSVPEYGLNPDEQEEFKRFFQQMDTFSKQKGKDGKFIFDIPTIFASQAHDLVDLDMLSMEKWMQEQAYTSENLYQYVNYCCRDDFGTGIKNSSAFAGIHYFSSRKHDYYPDQEEVLTWQEGNSRLAKHLASFIQDKIQCGWLAYKVDYTGNQVKVYAFNSKTGKSTLFIVDRLLSACPQFVNQYLIPGRKELSKFCQYAPWITATITLKKFPLSIGSDLSWDNIIHGGKGLGYIYDQHQSLGQFKSPFVITYYHSLDSRDLKSERQKLYEWSEVQWKDFILEDLNKAHYGIAAEVETMEIFRLGHGMISPVPGFISSSARKQLERTIESKVFFAHSDLSGISIFEEAFYRGTFAAKEILETLR